MSTTPQSLDLTSYVAGTPIASSERLEGRWRDLLDTTVDMATVYLKSRRRKIATAASNSAAM